MPRRAGTPNPAGGGISTRTEARRLDKEEGRTGHSTRSRNGHLQESEGRGGASTADRPCDGARPSGPVWQPVPRALRHPWTPEVPYLTQRQHQGLVELSVYFAAGRAFAGAKLPKRLVVRLCPV